MWRMVLGVLLAVALPMSGQAVEISEKLPNGLTASADYRAGLSGAPAFLVLHGFLVTHQYPTVQSISNDLEGQGYSVLAPTLSLDVTGRRAGLACDAIHTHTLAKDLGEIEFWLDWLSRRTQGPIYLVGHSFGSIQLLAYLNNHAAPRVRGLFGISMSYMGAAGEEIRADEVQRAEAMLREGRRDLGRYNLLYCHNNYTSTPEGYLDYARLGRDQVLLWLRHAGRPVISIMGGADKRFGPDWVAAMREVGGTVQVVDGASHFFDGAYEFDLLEELSSSLGLIKDAQ